MEIIFRFDFLDMLFIQMCNKPDDEDQEVYFTGEHDNTPITSATQTLDLLALHLPPEKLVPYLVNIFMNC